MTKTLTLVLGGARSGKSSYAERLAGQAGGPVLYVATAQAGDDEMRMRIAKHRSTRPALWTTVEAATGVGPAVSAAQAAAAETVVVDCVTLLVSNVIIAGIRGDDPDQVESERAASDVEREIEGLLRAYDSGKASWIVVSNEVGLGLVPPYPLGRVYRDTLGWANQRLATAADRVVLMVAGLGLDVRALSSVAPRS